jgi:hypothetical protein
MWSVRDLDLERMIGFSIRVIRSQQVVSVEGLSILYMALVGHCLPQRSIAHYFSF